MQTAPGKKSGNGASCCPDALKVHSGGRAGHGPPGVIPGGRLVFHEGYDDGIITHATVCVQNNCLDAALSVCCNGSVKHTLFTLITLCALSLFPVCPAHDAGHDGGGAQQKAGFPEKKELDGKVPAVFQGECALEKGVWMVRMEKLNNHQLDKAVMAGLGEDHPDFSPAEGKKCAGIIPVSVPKGAESDPGKWRVSGKRAYAVQEDKPEYVARLNDLVLEYYGREIMNGMERYIGILDRMTDVKKLVSLNEELVSCCGELAQWVQVESSVGMDVQFEYIQRHQGLVEQYGALESQMKEALRRWQDRFGVDVMTVVDIVTGEREVCFWGIPVSFSADVLRDIVVRLRD